MAPLGGLADFLAGLGAFAIPGIGPAVGTALWIARWAERVTLAVEGAACRGAATSSMTVKRGS